MENRLKIKPEVFHQQLVRAWNRAAELYPTGHAWS